MLRLLVIACLGWSALASAIPVKTFCQQYEQKRQSKELSRAVQQCIEVINSGLSQKRFNYQAEAAAGCVKALGSREGEVCTGVIVGSKQGKAPCESSLECDQSLVCRGGRGGPPGTCQPPLTEGDPCDDKPLVLSSFVSDMALKRNTCGPGYECKPRDLVLRCTKKP